MTLPTTLRTNVLVPFPARVQGSGPVVVTKANGIWTISLNPSLLAVQTPTPGQYATDYLLVYDSLAKTFISMPLTVLSTLPSAATRAQRSVTASPIVIVGTDQILNCNINAGAPTCALPTAASRNGLALTWKDVGGHFGAHNLTITPNGAEKIDGAANLILGADHQGVTLVPFNDGTNSGWAIQ